MSSVQQHLSLYFLESHYFEETRVTDRSDDGGRVQDTGQTDDDRVQKEITPRAHTCLGFGGDPFLNSKIVLVDALPVHHMSFVPWGWVRGLARH